MGIVTTVWEVIAVLCIAFGVGVVVAAVVPGPVGVGVGMVSAGVLLLLSAWVAERRGAA